MRPAAVLALPCCAAAAVAGCGGGSGTALSRPDYLKRADAICTRYDARQARLGTPKDVADLVTLSRRAKPLIQAEVAELRALKAPDAVKGDAGEAFDTLDASAQKLDALGAAAQAKDTRRITDIANQGAALSRKAKGLARRIGLRVCGKGA